MAVVGDRVVLVRIADSVTLLKPGARGTVTRIDSLGTVDVRWDDGHDLGLIPGVDEWSVLAPVAPKDVVCPTCHSAVGIPCYDGAAAKPSNLFHEARIEAAK